MGWKSHRDDFRTAGHGHGSHNAKPAMMRRKALAFYAADKHKPFPR